MDIILPPLQHEEEAFSIQSLGECHLCKVNGVKFAIFNKPVTGDKLKIDYGNYNVIFLKRVTTKRDLLIKGLSIVCFDEIICGGKEGFLLEVPERKFFMLNQFADRDYLIVEGGHQHHLTHHVPDRVQKKRLVKKFSTGIAEKHALTLINALMETYGSIDMKGISKIFENYIFKNYNVADVSGPESLGTGQE